MGDCNKYNKGDHRRKEAVDENTKFVLLVILENPEYWIHHVYEVHLTGQVRLMISMLIEFSRNTQSWQVCHYRTTSGGIDCNSWGWSVSMQTDICFDDFN